MTEFAVRPLHPEDRAGWEVLYRGYAEFYRVAQTPAMRDTVWGWLHDPARESCGIVAAQAGGGLLGLAHYRPFARPLSATVGCFLDDLFVAPEARGTGVADALLESLREIAAGKGWSVIRWITAENNYRARAAYDRIATRTGWVTYDMAVGPA